MTVECCEPGWERAENEAAAFKAQLEAAEEQRLGAEDRVQHLDGALKEVVKQLRSAREEQEQRVHEVGVKKAQECDAVRVEMEAKVAESALVVAQTRAELIEARAESQALTHALQVEPRSCRRPLHPVAVTMYSVFLVTIYSVFLLLQLNFGTHLHLVE